MNSATKQKIVQRANERRGAISDSKGPEYAGSADAYHNDDQDVLANFKRQDVRWGHNTDGLASAFIYFGKHLDSIETFGRELRAAMEGNWTREMLLELVGRGEGILSRLDDARNYLDLIECLLADAKLHPDPLPYQRLTNEELMELVAEGERRADESGYQEQREEEARWLSDILSAPPQGLVHSAPAFEHDSPHAEGCPLDGMVRVTDPDTPRGWKYVSPDRADALRRQGRHWDDPDDPNYP